MLRVSLAWVIESVRDIESLTGIEVTPNGISAWISLMKAKNSITAMLNQSIYSQHLRVSAEKVRKLEGLLKEALDKAANPDDVMLDQTDVWMISEAKKDLLTVLLSELATLPVFMITDKESFDLNRLIDAGNSLFPTLMLAKAPETWSDAMEAGRCLAFERNTACGFHAFRVVEAVLRRYWDSVADGKARPEPQTLGTMSGQLKMCSLGDSKVTESLIQMTKLHRNPISHPDVVLTGDEAISILGMARSVITHMISVLPDIPPTTGMPSGLPQS